MSLLSGQQQLFANSFAPLVAAIDDACLLLALLLCYRNIFNRQTTDFRGATDSPTDNSHATTANKGRFRALTIGSNSKPTLTAR
jgi:hypothetical protein